MALTFHGYSTGGDVMAVKPTRGKAGGTKVSLIVSDEKDVKVSARAGMKLNVVKVDAITPDLKKASRVGARLCGFGTNICLAFTEIQK
jgi:hypothetical protein